MIVRSIEDIINSDRNVAWGNGQSRRFLVESDTMGYSLTDTIINAGTTSLLEYKNHLEACYCIEGEGTVETVDEGKIYSIKAGTMYALDKNDKHYLTAHTTMRLVCVFLPALEGHEVHNLAAEESSCY
ncbi:ectoine synthase [Maricurvus nonylphenolicus]|uniref:ectoine synthase n=1 Tax=Maricurvus nonylphenolicus TaxID=1008307 RepID=UPI0036F2CED9